MNLSRFVYLCAALALAWMLYTMARPTPHTPPASIASGELRVGKDRITPLQPFQLEARILGREDYRFDAGARLSPTDLALGWGPMADPAVLAQIRITQGNRWYHWSTERFPIPRREIETHSANMHMIPATAQVARDLADVAPGQRISISGQLVRVDGDDGFTWVSSLTREDTGNGACELVWLERIERLD
ncbi:hypothetical protein QN096_20600 [Metapseudomonas otitidis]|uniref:hypothetical protein n=1 Tax=Metapseudomonas otitidis TaxID=319939 RepID=UPI00254036A9|nr:hypothetical protein [Pseudomonas otitidis]WIF66145.1 hypothetical protein QN096_20600 [Pseudomonas otitidis]